MESSPQSNCRVAISDILYEAWGLINVSKWPIWAIAIFVGIASLIAQVIIISLFQIDPEIPLFIIIIFLCR